MGGAADLARLRMAGRSAMRSTKRSSTRSPNWLLQLCEGVLRLPGDSKGADNDVRIARERGIPVWNRLEDVPGCG